MAAASQRSQSATFPAIFRQAKSRGRLSQIRLTTAYSLNDCGDLTAMPKRVVKLAVTPLTAALLNNGNSGSDCSHKLKATWTSAIKSWLPKSGQPQEGSNECVFSVSFLLSSG